MSPLPVLPVNKMKQSTEGGREREGKGREGKKGGRREEVRQGGEEEEAGRQERNKQVNTGNQFHLQTGWANPGE